MGVYFKSLWSFFNSVIKIHIEFSQLFWTSEIIYWWICLTGGLTLIQTKNQMKMRIFHKTWYVEFVKTSTWILGNWFHASMFFAKHVSEDLIRPEFQIVHIADDKLRTPCQWRIWGTKSWKHTLNKFKKGLSRTRIECLFIGSTTNSSSRNAGAFGNDYNIHLRYRYLVLPFLHPLKNFVPHVPTNM